MKKTDLHFCLRAILSVESGIKRIQQPSVLGKNGTVFIVEKINGDKTVFRFGQRHTVHRNTDISQILSKHSINAPKIQSHLFQGYYFETYPYLRGQTLAEKLKNKDIICCPQDVCAGVAVQIKRLAEIPVADFQNIENKFCHNVAQKNMQNASKSHVAGQIVKVGTKLLNHGSQSICHCDLTPENIIVADNMMPKAILDLNAISISNVNFAVAISAMGLERYNIDQNLFLHIADDIMPGQINKNRIHRFQSIHKQYLGIYSKLKRR